MKLKHINYGMLALFISLLIASYQFAVIYGADFDEYGNIVCTNTFLQYQYDQVMTWINIIANSIFLWFTGQGVYQIIQLIKRKRNGKRNTTN